MYPHSQKQNVFFLTILLYFQTIFKHLPSFGKKGYTFGAHCIGDTSRNILENILGLGFNFVDKVKFLGFEVSNTQQWNENNIQNATKKVRKLVRFWSRFRLSLIGKITIYKTLLMPQINFLSTIIMPTNDSIIHDHWAWNINEQFCTQGMTIAKSFLH